MVKFRNAVGDAPVTKWWDNDNHQIAFARKHRGFMAINNDYHPLVQRLPTDLPSGTYCDVISGNLESKC